MKEIIILGVMIIISLFFLCFAAYSFYRNGYIETWVKMTISGIIYYWFSLRR